MKTSPWFGLILLLLLAVSCVNKEVKLPINDIAGIQETIYDNTQIWMFYVNVDGNPSLKLNKNNKISSTNWIFNIDKRLPMALVAPEVEAMVNSRKEEEDPSKKKDLHHYFSYVDTLSNKMSTIKFDKIEYRTVSDFPRPRTPIDSADQTITLIIKPTLLEVNGTVSTAQELKAVLTKKAEKKLVINLYFDEEILYERYIYFKALLAPYTTENPDGNTIEYILKN